MKTISYLHTTFTFKRNWNSHEDKSYIAMRKKCEGFLCLRKNMREEQIFKSTKKEQANLFPCQ